MLRVYYSILIFYTAISSLYAQEPVADFSISNEVCLEENINIVNSSANASQYFWDFCLGDLENVPSVAGNIKNSDFNKSSNITIIKENNQWYGFMASRFGKKIFRLNFGDDLNNDPSLVALEISDDSFSQPIDIELIKENSTWYGLLIDTNNKAFRLTFDSITDLNPNLEILSSFNALNLLNIPFDISILKDTSDIYAIVANYNNSRITKMSFGNSIINEPVGVNYNVSGGLSLSGGSFVKKEGIWQGLVTARGNNRLFSVIFSSGLENAPVISQVTLNNITLTEPVGVSIVEDKQNDYYAFVQSLKGNLYRIAHIFEASIGDENLGNLNAFTTSSQGVKVIRSGSNWIGFTVSINDNKIDRFTFPNNCDISEITAKDFEPKDISFNQSGVYDIRLDAYNEDSNVSSAFQSITVNGNIAPEISFQTNNACIIAANTFSGTSPQSDITNWLWDYGNDSLAIGQEVTYQYDTVGTYNVTLEVDASNGCSQRITQPITIYEPPEPDFLLEASGALCSNGTVSFINQTNTQGADSLISYNWNFNEEDSTNVTDPEFIFLSGGDKTVTLTAVIPGCGASKDTTFTVFEGPEVNFAFENQCAGEAVQFLNQTTGSNITGYQWDFGDGNTFSSPTLSSPEHVFEGAGEYDVSLTVNDAQGCENEVVQSFHSFAKPEAAFSAELSCAGTPTLFTDETQIDVSANVVLWQWDFGDQTPNADTKNPEHAFGSPGDYTVQLVAETNEGCADVATQQIVVETPVQPGFEAIKICPSGELDVQLNDTSVVTGGEAVTQWLWQVEGEIYQTQNPVHTFAEPGEYTVSLTATASSLCNASVTRTVTVVPLPEADFSFTQACANDAVAFADQSAYPEYIATYLWDFGGAGTSIDASPAFVFEEAGTYPVELMIEDINGCTDTLTQSIEILPQPVAGFTVEKTTGAAPFVVSFDNTSTDASQYQWDFAGLDTSTVLSPTFTFEEVGTYPVQLAVANPIGCADTLLRTFTVIKPVFDIALDNISLQPAANGGSGTNIILTVSNPGTLPVQGFHVAVKIDQQLALDRSFGSTIEPGATMNFPLGVAFSNINNSEQNTRYVCATLTPLEDNFAEAEKGDNIFCLNIDESFYSLPPFPNPVQGLLDIPLILPAAEVVDMTLATATGNVLQNYTFSDLQVGLNTLQLDVSPLPSGVYILTIRFQARVNTYRLVINP